MARGRRPTTWRYRATAGDELRSGEMVAPNEAAVITSLRREGMRPIVVEPARPPLWSRELRLPGTSDRVKLAELAPFTRQLHTMLAAGLPLLRALRVLSLQSRGQRLGEVVEVVADDVRNGSSLAEAIGHHPETFDGLYVALVAAGERAGALDVVLEQIAGDLERAAALRRTIRGALAYPMVVLAVIGLVTAAMLLFVVPVFADIYADLDSTLPGPTQALVDLSSLLTSRAPFIVGALVLGVWGARRFRRSASGRRTLDSLSLRLPLFGGLARNAAIARFARSMTVLLGAGLPLVDSLRVAAATMGNTHIAAAVGEASTGVRQGGTLSDELERTGLFPPLAVQMVAAGEETGRLEALFTNLAGFYEDEVDSSASTLASLLEPLMMLVMGAVVGTMVVALYLPMFNIIDLVE
ncbi:MAG: type II secretion system F family protein [Actinomycetota bacterium]|nr:type II secretion system F family protein [Actinomycetota bacterium]